MLFHLSRDLCPQLARTFGVSQRGLLALEELRSDPAVDADHWTSEPTTGSRRGQAGEEAEHAVDGVSGVALALTSTKPKVLSVR